MPTSETQRVEEIRQKLNKVYLRLAYGKSDIETAKKEVNEILTQDRASLYTSLVAAVEGKKRANSYCGYSFSKSTIDVKTAVECINGAEKMGYNKALKDTLTIINSIFKE